MKAEDTTEPLWSGVTSIEDAGSGVTVHFEPAPSPALRRAGNVDVACVLYPERPLTAVGTKRITAGFLRCGTNRQSGRISAVGTTRQGRTPTDPCGRSTTGQW